MRFSGSRARIARLLVWAMCGLTLRVACRCRTCLEPDVRPHEGRGYALRDVAATARAQKSVRYWKHVSLVTVRGGQLHVATLSPSGTPPSPTPRRVSAPLFEV